MSSSQHIRAWSLAKRLVFWPLLLLFAGLCAWWSLYFPYDAALMRRAIPPYATAVSEHYEIAARWPEIARHPLIDAVLKTVDEDPGGAKSVVQGPELARWIERLTGNQTLAAYVPEGTPGAPITGWIAVSWVGAYGQLLRWGLLNRAIRDFVPGRARDGTRIWRMASDAFPSGYVLSLTACEGIALMCLSPDQDAASYLRARIACRARAIDRFAGALKGVTDADIETAPDRAWIGMPGTRGFESVRAGLTFDAGRHITLTATGYQWPVEGRTLTRQDVASMWPLLRHAPDCLVAAPSADLFQAVALASVPDAATLVLDAIAEQAAPGGASFICLTSSDYSGRLLSVRVPGLLAGVKLKDEVDVQALTTRILDRLSAEHGKGFIPCRADIEGQSVITVGDSRLVGESMMPLEERPAVSEWGGWLLLSSNARVLSHLLEVAGPASDLATKDLPPMPPWARELTSGSLCAYAWADSRATSAALKNAIAVYELSLMLKRSSRGRSARARLAPFKAALTYLEPVGEAVLRCEKTAASARSTLRVSPRQGE